MAKTDEVVKGWTETPKDLEEFVKLEKEKRQIVAAYIKDQMVEGIDYGTIEMKSRTGAIYESKPTLFKAGSEKFCSLFNLRPVFSYEHQDFEKGYFVLKCELLNRKTSEIIGEGRGAAQVAEKVNWSVNNALKIAEKRAQIDAVLRTGGLSDFFTQDLEDMAQADKTPAKPQKVATAPNLKPQVKQERVSGAQLRKLYVQLNQLGRTKDDLEKYVGKLENLTMVKASEVIEEFDTKIKSKVAGAAEAESAIPPETEQ